MHITSKILITLAVASIIVSIVFDSLLRKFQPTSVLLYALSFVVYYLIITDQECVIGYDACITWGWIKFLITFTLLVFFIYLKIYNGVLIFKNNKIIISQRSEEESQ